MLFNVRWLQVFQEALPFSLFMNRITHIIFLSFLFATFYNFLFIIRLLRESCIFELIIKYMRKEGFRKQKKRLFWASYHISHILQISLNHINGLSKILALELDINIFVDFIKIDQQVTNIKILFGMKHLEGNFDIIHENLVSNGQEFSRNFNHIDKNHLLLIFLLIVQFLLQRPIHQNLLVIGFDDRDTSNFVTVYCEYDVLVLLKCEIFLNLVFFLLHPIYSQQLLYCFHFLFLLQLDVSEKGTICLNQFVQPKSSCI